MMTDGIKLWIIRIKPPIEGEHDCYLVRAADERHALAFVRRGWTKILPTENIISCVELTAGGLPGVLFTGEDWLDYDD